MIDSRCFIRAELVCESEAYNITNRTIKTEFHGSFQIKSNRLSLLRNNEDR